MVLSHISFTTTDPCPVIICLLSHLLLPVTTPTNTLCTTPTFSPASGSASTQASLGTTIRYFDYFLANHLHALDLSHLPSYQLCKTLFLINMVFPDIFIGHYSARRKKHTCKDWCHYKFNIFSLNWNPISFRFGKTLQVIFSHLSPSSSFSSLTKKI